MPLGDLALEHWGDDLEEGGTFDATPYNHYSMLRAIEDNFGVSHLGYAGQPGLTPIDLGACNDRHQ